ncbi:MAG: cyclic beta 1-2 glucan synthetase, partial [Phycisphaerae bacterium]
MLARACGRRALFLYLFGILLLTAAGTMAFLGWSVNHGAGVRALCYLAVPILLCAMHFAINVVNWFAMSLVKPRPLPRLSLRDGIPPPQRTMVVVPTMLSNAAGIEKLLEGLEVRYLANRGDNLHFALLTDFEDAAQEQMPDDEELVRLACLGIESLNQKYELHRSDIFYLFHRARTFNPHDRLWMGYERKRGKLADLNAVLRGAPDRFSHVVGNRQILPQVQYVITLDTDTQLPRDSARALIGALAHPLNRPVFDPQQRRIVDGYGILQPRVGISLPGARRSWFVRLCAGECGIDPYTRVVSDLYQDLFGEGTFIGKGIYDVDAFQQTCGSFPENAILSHDLLESAYARSALLSDVALYEEYPARYLVDVGRRHRWVRGDWQILGWLLPWVRTSPQPPAPDRSQPLPRTNNPISGLAWWKIFDNLRRSLVPPAVMVLLLECWLLLSAPGGTGAVWWVLLVLGGGSLLALLSDLFVKPRDLPLKAHLRATLSTLGRSAAQFLFMLATLPYEAGMHLDAIGRTLVRVFLTKRRMLEWKTFREAEQSVRDNLPAHLRAMWMAPLLAVLILVTLILLHRPLAPLAAPLLSLWFVSPFLAWWLSHPIARPQHRLSDAQHRFLDKLSRRTWRFFEVFVTAEENWLPPDNIQEQPAPVVAPRTSPTNIGVTLLANLAAYDFGYCSAAALLDRTETIPLLLEAI